MDPDDHSEDRVHLDIDLTRLRRTSLGDAADPNHPVTPAQLTAAVDGDQLAAFAGEVGIPADELTARLSEALRSARNLPVRDNYVMVKFKTEDDERAIDFPGHRRAPEIEFWFEVDHTGTLRVIAAAARHRE
ncbi:hypothetical protein NDR87_00800 [Nocardia sp. CDC159]|uniref:Uncharacterized protein n=1 Tax=Nocardia pulmonis TaxID=2951408 RepID=A0A9X2IVH1_9NOCA|nr:MULTISPECIES: hypothetical protein [Nocardia]MCM6772449.1 hypothetical protein [Nocardia pulmonis]MCM6784893.1 hypothetical protein [Nocardia sp. CDC159]